jgi:hypothetical protein
VKAIAPLSSGLQNETKEKDTRKAAKKFAVQLRQHEASPQALLDNLTSAFDQMHDVAPTVTQTAAMTVAAAFRALRSRADSVIPAPDPLQPQLDDANQLPSREAAQKFAREVDVVLNPTAALDRLADGTITSGEVAVLREVYPTLHAMVSAQLTERLASLDTRIPYQTRVSLALWFGSATDRTLAPDFIMRGQRTYSEPPPGNMAGPGPQVGPQVRAKGLDKSDKLVTMFKSNSQRIGQELGSG